MITLRYSEREWRFDEFTGELVIAGGARILLCSERRPKQGARPVVRRGEDDWQVAPAIYRAGFFKRVEDDFYFLSGAPPAVSARLWELL